MSLAKLIELSVPLTAPPPESVIVCRQKPVEGPGGRWIPCVTKTPGGLYLASLFQVGEGCKLICAADRPMRSLDDALTLAAELAEIAAC